MYLLIKENINFTVTYISAALRPLKEARASFFFLPFRRIPESEQYRGGFVAEYPEASTGGRSQGTDIPGVSDSRFSPSLCSLGSDVT